jgi:hypothetical protein
LAKSLGGNLLCKDFSVAVLQQKTFRLLFLCDGLEYAGEHGPGIFATTGSPAADCCHRAFTLAGRIQPDKPIHTPREARQGKAAEVDGD